MREESIGDGGRRALVMREESIGDGEESIGDEGGEHW